MRKPDMLDFPLQEYTNRLNKLTACMKTAGLDAVLLTAAENMRYFTGLQSVVWPSGISTPGVFIVTQNGDYATVSSASSLRPLMQTSWVPQENMFAFAHGSSEWPESYVEAIYAAFKRLGVHKGRIGAELGSGFRINLQAGYYLPLVQMLKDGGAEICDAGSVLWELRMIKSPAELEYLRKAVVCAEHMFDAAFSSIELGKTTERDLFYTMGATAIEDGCEDLLNMVVRFGLDRMWQVNCPSSDVVISNTPGAILHLDGGPCYKGYYADIIRQAVVGGLTPQQQEYEKIHIESIQAGLAQVKDGALGSSVAAAADAVLEKYGFGECNDSPGWVGHGIGLDVHEEPQLGPSNGFVLRSGMVFSVEPGFKVRGVGGFCSEQNVVVTDTGYELLSCTPLEMRVI